MKIKEPEEFNEFFEKYKITANYYVALSLVSDIERQHALWLCMRDAFIEGQNLIQTCGEADRELAIQKMVEALEIIIKHSQHNSFFLYDKKFVEDALDAWRQATK